MPRLQLRHEIGANSSSSRRTYAVKARAPSVAVRVPVQQRTRSLHSRALTTRQLEYLRELAAGKTNKEMAVTLVVTNKSVETMNTVLYSRLGVRNRAEAVRVAIEQGLVPLRPRWPGGSTSASV